MSTNLLQQLATATRPTAVKQLLKQLKATPHYQPITALYQSIWTMTYQQSSDPEFSSLSIMSRHSRVKQLDQSADQIALMNEQEDLIPKSLVPIDPSVVTLCQERSIELLH